MHAAAIERSERLQKTLAVLADGAEHSTLDISHSAGVCAVNSCVAELRANGHVILCRRVFRAGRHIWLYRLVPAQDSPRP